MPAWLVVVVLQHAVSAASSCDGLAWEGRCDGETLVYCDDQTDAAAPAVRATDCAALGQSCSYVAAYGYNDCARVDDLGGCASLSPRGGMQGFAMIVGWLAGWGLLRLARQRGRWLGL